MGIDKTACKLRILLPESDRHGVAAAGSGILFGEKLAFFQVRAPTDTHDLAEAFEFCLGSVWVAAGECVDLPCLQKPYSSDHFLHSELTCGSASMEMVLPSMESGSSTSISLLTTRYREPPKWLAAA